MKSAGACNWPNWINGDLKDYLILFLACLVVCCLQCISGETIGDGGETVGLGPITFWPSLKRKNEYNKKLGGPPKQTLFVEGSFQCVKAGTLFLLQNPNTKLSEKFLFPPKK